MIKIVNNSNWTTFHNDTTPSLLNVLLAHSIDDDHWLTCILTFTVSNGCPVYTQAAEPTTDAITSFTVALISILLLLLFQYN